MRRAKAPELPVVLLEDTAALNGLVLALAGVGLTAVTGDGVFDAIGTLCIGALLIAVAVVLGIETKSLLVGEGANPADLDRVVAAIERGDGSTEPAPRRIHVKTLYLGPDELLVAAEIGLPRDEPLGVVADAIDTVEARIRAVVPAARVAYLEPDVYDRSLDPRRADPSPTLPERAPDA